MAPPGGSGVEVKGDKRLASSFDRAMRNIDRMDPDKSARMLQTTAQRFAPVRTGRLRSSITTRRRTGGGSLVVSDLRYAGYVEYGTRKMRGRRFAQRALEARQDDMVEQISKDVQQELDTTVRGA